MVSRHSYSGMSIVGVCMNDTKDHFDAQTAIRIVRTLWKNMCMPKNHASWATMAHLQAQAQDHHHKAYQAHSVKRASSLNVKLSAI